MNTAERAAARGTLNRAAPGLRDYAGIERRGIRAVALILVLLSFNTAHLSDKARLAPATQFAYEIGVHSAGDVVDRPTEAARNTNGVPSIRTVVHGADAFVQLVRRTVAHGATCRYQAETQVDCVDGDLHVSILKLPNAAVLDVQVDPDQITY